MTPPMEIMAICRSAGDDWEVWENLHDEILVVASIQSELVALLRTVSDVLAQRPL